MATPIDKRTTGGNIGVTKARGATRVGLIWMLVISTAAAVVVVFGIWAIESGRLASSEKHSGPTAVTRTAAAQFHTPPSSGS